LEASIPAADPGGFSEINSNRDVGQSQNAFGNRFDLAPGARLQILMNEEKRADAFEKNEIRVEAAFGAVLPGAVD
jgi:hypothetical protein